MKTITPSSRLLLALVALFAMAHLAGAATFIWSVSTPASNNWNVVGNWSSGAATPGASDLAMFGQVGVSPNATTVNNVVSVNTTVTGLAYNNTNVGSTVNYHVTQILTNVTLTVTGTFTNGGIAGASTGPTTVVSVTGPGTLLVQAPVFHIGNNAANSGSAPATLDLSALSNFVYSASTGTFNMGNEGSRSLGNLNLAAQSNSITASTININTGATSTGTTGSFNLGGGTNIINAGTINVSAARNSTPMQFPGTTGGLRVRGVNGGDTDRATMVLANRSTGGSSTITVGSLLANNHQVDLKFSTLTLGQASATGSTGGPNAVGANGILTFNQGTVDATTINMAVCAQSNQNALATITVGTNAAAGVSGLLTIGNGGLSLANLVPLTVSQGPNSATGTLFVAGGTVTCAGNIIKTSSSGSGNIVLSNGMLTASGTIGTASAPIDTFSLSNAILTIAAANTTNGFVTALNLGASTNIISVSSTPSITSYPAQYPLISYASLTGDPTTLGALFPPASPAFEGYISNNVAANRLDVVITNGPPVAKPVTWGGQIRGDWDLTTANWTNSGAQALYAQNDFALFDDTAGGTTTVNLTGTPPR
jgi:hypothetical protein